jgi:hypothetical protein
MPTAPDPHRLAAFGSRSCPAAGEKEVDMAYQGKYDAPEDILHDEGLGRDEKTRLLQAWRDDKKAYMRASGEGMEGDDRADLLKRIKKALASLQA